MQRKIHAMQPFRSCQLLGMMAFLAMLLFASACFDESKDEDSVVEDNVQQCVSGSCDGTDFTASIPLSNESNNGASLTCSYESADVTDRPCCTLTKTTVSGTGLTPASVEVDKDGVTLALPSISGNWTATGNGLNCSGVGCVEGTYSVTVTYEVVDDLGCPGAVDLTLQIP